MKKKTIFCLLVFFLFSLKIEASQLSLKLFAGGSWVEAGDLCENIRGWKDFSRDHNKNPYSFGYDVKELHLFMESGTELAWSFSSRFYVALGLEFIAGSTEGEMTSSFSQKQNYSNSSIDFGTIFIEEQSSQQPKYKLQAIPITLTFYYSFNLGNRINFFLGGGGGYYSGKMTYMEDYQYDFDYRDEKNYSGSLLQFVDQYSSSGTYSEESTCKAFGLHGKVGFEIKIHGRFHLIIEALGRRVDFKDWRGSKRDSYSWSHTWGYWGAFSDTGASEEAGDGKLWMVEFESDETGKSYPRLVFSEEKPLVSSYSGARPARINMNGFSLRIGIRISL